MVESASLAGVAVLVTRPLPQAHRFAEALRIRGAVPFVMPVLYREPLPLSPVDRQRLLDLDRYDGVICVSDAAARLGVQACADVWPQWPAGQTWMAVGPATAAPLEGWGLALRVAPAGSRSETLLDWPDLQQVEGRRFLIMRGEGGRETLAATLRSRGAEVDYLELYRRCDAEPQPQVLDAFLASDAARVVTVTSGETLEALCRLSAARASVVCALPMVVVSGRLAAHAREQGCGDIILAPGAQDDALCEAIAARMKQRQ